MAQAPDYDRQFGFTDYQTEHPVTPLPGNQVDAELNAVKQTLDALLANIALIQRDDGQLANLSVGSDQLKAGISFGINSATNWGAGVNYGLRDGVFQGNAFYVCVVAHTSTVFATNLASGYWQLILNFDPYVSTAAASAVTASSAAISAAASYDAFDDRYLGAKAADPTLDNDGNALLTGALYFNTVSNTMRVYSGSSWAAIQSAVQRVVYRYIATAAQTVFSGGDVNANVLAYSASNFVTVYQNGSRKAENTYTATSGTSVVLGSGATVSDVIQIEVITPVAGFGTLAAQNASAVNINGGLIAFASIRAWTFRISFSGLVSAVTDKLVFTSPAGLNLQKIRCKTSAGTCAVTLKKNATIITGANGLAVTSAAANSLTTAANIFSQDDAMKITIGSITGAYDLEIWGDAVLDWS